MKNIGSYHIPALLNKTIELLKVKSGSNYIDATLGGGGHSSEIVNNGGNLLAIDRDPEAIEHCSSKIIEIYKKNLEKYPKLNQPIFIWDNFLYIDKIAKDQGFEPVDGILFDLGVSSHQLESSDRGFSFNQEGPLDMRMDPRLSVTAEDLVNGLNQGELYELFTKLGEEKFSKKIAAAICLARGIKKIQTCDQLAQIILKSVPKRGTFDRTHPATRIFQALRIAVNDEINALKETLPKSVELLNKNGRLVVLSFHSLEDGIVKRFFLDKQKQGVLKIITEKPIVPTDEESSINPRARSAKLRAAEKII